MENEYVEDEGKQAISSLAKFEGGQRKHSGMRFTSFWFYATLENTLVAEDLEFLHLIDEHKNTSEKVKGNVSGDHMITLGSDAHLEAVDFLDPFSKVLLVATGNKTTGSGIELVSAATAAYIYV
ncbi:hypothetical protein DVH24_009555 [Malus domestica]|uniref:Uncharacterized protein n=1 Tax=Malus domestica TaxID=3750 RepID=A0A498IU77_MALDO|nr:hypothetical protein DVH24_009555 [Malus domestica]